MKNKNHQIVRLDCKKRTSLYTSHCQFKESKRAVKSIGRLVEEDDDEDVEKVNWSGEPVGSETGLSLENPALWLAATFTFSTCLLRYLLVSQRNRSVQSEDRERARPP